MYAGSAETPDSWLGKSIKGLPGVNINICIHNSFTRAEVYINSGEKAENKQIFDKMLAHKSELEVEVGEAMTWQRMDEKVTCRICITRDNLSYLNPDDKEAIFSFLLNTTNRMMKAFTSYAQKYARKG